MDVGPACGVPNLLGSRIYPTITEIVFDGVVEKRSVLWNYTDSPSQTIQGQIANVLAIN
ncbi:hypothetical protein ACKS0A_06267 [Histoplasma ohiense]